MTPQPDLALILEHEENTNCGLCGRHGYDSGVRIKASERESGITSIVMCDPCWKRLRQFAACLAGSTQLSEQKEDPATRVGGE